MPFTPAHTAAVLPLLKSRRFSATGLVIGSMAPDFEYFLKMSVNSRFSHTIGGLFYFDVPITFLLAVIFHVIIKHAMIDNLPGFLRQRLLVLRNLDFWAYLRGHLLVFAYSALIGSITHVAWDGFTHVRGYFVSELPWVYEGVVVPFDGARYPLWYALQQISTGVGLIILLVYVAAQKPMNQELHKPRLAYWIGVVLISLIVLLLRFGFDWTHVLLGNLVVSIISALSIAVIVMGSFSLIKGKSINHG